MTEAGSEQYQKILFQIARKIHRTLDLDSIWQQTVRELGEALDVSRCIICPYESASKSVPITAEYRRSPYRSMLGLDLVIADYPYLSEALTSLEPIAVEQLPPDDPFELQSLLVGVTRYKGEPNGLISLHQCRSAKSGHEMCPHHWSDAEILLVQELAEEVGSAIAHATLYKRSQEALASAECTARLKSQWLANSSHELRTALNTMIGGLQLLLYGMADDPEEQMELLHFAYRGSQNLMKIINDSLDFAMLETEQMELYLEPVRLSELLHDIKHHTLPQVKEKNLSFQIKKPATQHEIFLYSNYQRLRQVLSKLIDNAIKFTPFGGITISAEIVQQQVKFHNLELPGMVKVSVRDTGIGVPIHRQDQLFQPPKVMIGDGSRPSNYSGITGWGLIFSKKLIEAMGGELSFYSEGTECGSTVSFTVPLYQKVTFLNF